MSQVVISVQNLGKQYRIGQREPYRTLRDLVTNAMKAPFQSSSSPSKGKDASNDLPSAEQFIWALRNVTFEVEQGQVIGVLGRNGAGKTTLLKILSRITDPTEGVVDIYGRVGSLLEVGTGFHLELTGRENIYLNGAILGMKRDEIDKKFDEIIQFSEVEKFIDTPVKHYSSGMFMRLAFSVAAHLEPEILLVDEVLAVGDAAFQKKCLGKMDEIAQGGRTILFVSHNLQALEAICTRSFLLHHGELITTGPTEEVIRYYKETFGESHEFIHRESRLLTWRGILNRESLTNRSPSEDLDFDLLFETGVQPVDKLHVDISIQNERGETVIHGKSKFVTQAVHVPSLTAIKVSYHIKSPKLAPGKYTMTVYAYSAEGILFWGEGIEACHINAKPYFGIVQAFDELKSSILPEYEVDYTIDGSIS